MFLHVIPFNKYNRLGIYYMKYILTSSLGLLTTNACLSLSPRCIQEEQDVTLHKYYKYNVPVFSWDTLMWHCFLPVCLSSELWNLSFITWTAVAGLDMKACVACKESNRMRVLLLSGWSGSNLVYVIIKYFSQRIYDLRPTAERMTKNV